MIFARSSKLRHGTLAMMEIIWTTITGVSSDHGDFRLVTECLSREGMSIVSCGSVSQQSDPGIGMYIWGLWHVNCDWIPVIEYGSKSELMQESHTEDSRRSRAQVLRMPTSFRTHSQTGDSKKAKKPEAIVSTEKALT